MATDPDQRSYVCPFCDSTYVVEFSRDETDRQRPEFVIGYGLDFDGKYRNLPHVAVVDEV